jgi:hypothetical protein
MSSPWFCEDEIYVKIPRFYLTFNNVCNIFGRSFTENKLLPARLATLKKRVWIPNRDFMLDALPGLYSLQELITQ